MLRVDLNVSREEIKSEAFERRIELKNAAAVDDRLLDDALARALELEPYIRRCQFFRFTFFEVRRLDAVVFLVIEPERLFVFEGEGSHCLIAWPLVRGDVPANAVVLAAELMDPHEVPGVALDAARGIRAVIAVRKLAVIIDDQAGGR